MPDSALGRVAKALLVVLVIMVAVAILVRLAH